VPPFASLQFLLHRRNSICRPRKVERSALNKANREREMTRASINRITPTRAWAGCTVALAQQRGLLTARTLHHREII